MYAAPASTLPVTGLAMATGHYIVAATTLLFFGFALLRLIPRKES